MARKPRVWFPGATYHITARGNRKEQLFYDKQDYHHYLDLIRKCRNELPAFHIHAYCLMPNHIHLLLEAAEIPPGEIIKFIHSRYATQFNKKYDYCGHVFQGRFHAGIVLSNDYFLKASRYIHLNPVRAGLAVAAENYLWSSYFSYLHPDEKNPLLETRRTLSLFEEPAMEAYCTYVETEQEEDKMEDNPHHFNALTY